MKRSTERILTTHGGRLDGPPELRDVARTIKARGCVDPESILPELRRGVAFVVRKQAEAGIDIVSDGELGHLGFGIGHFGRRLGGLEARSLEEGEPGWMTFRTGERTEFAEFYGELDWKPPREQVVCTAPITYIGHEEIARDIALFESARVQTDVRAQEAFLCAVAPGWLEHFFVNEHYAGDEEFLFALADAMSHEYKAIVDAGFVLQIDDPALPNTYDMIAPPPSIEEYREHARVRIEALNRALEGIPADRVRYHICWGSWHGPHTHDLPLEHVVDLMLDVEAQAYSVEAANPRHEHEWKLWKKRELPEGKLLIPGVVSHATNVVEHPEVVADRILRYADAVGRENVIAGTDCGLGQRVHPQIAWAKLKALAEGAALAGRRLWGSRGARD